MAKKASGQTPGITAEQFLADLKKRKSVLASAAKEVPAGFLDNDQIIDLFKLEESSKTVEFHVAKVSFGVNKNKHKFIRFGFIVTEPEYKGVQLSEMFSLDTTDTEKYERAVKSIMFQLQSLGYDTTEWEEDEILTNIALAVEELNRDKPSGEISLKLAVVPGKKMAGGKQAPDKKYLNLKVVKMFGPDAEGEEEEELEEEEIEEVEVEEEEVEADVDEDDPANWIGLEAIYDGVAVEIKKWNARKKTLEVYDAENDETYTVKADDLEWEE